MKKCPNCGRILHDDSIFCFGCMSEINKRQEIVLATPKKVFLKAKITTPIIAVALVSATVFGVYTYNNNSDKTTAVKKSTPQSAATVTTNTPVTTTLPPVTTVMTTTTKKREPDKAALASDIAEGAALAESKAAAVTTTTTTEKVTEPVTEPEIQQDIPPSEALCREVVDGLDHPLQRRGVEDEGGRSQENDGYGWEKDLFVEGGVTHGRLLWQRLF